MNKTFRNSKYDLEISRYMSRQPDFAKIIDDQIMQKTFQSILNKTALFLGIKCDNCNSELVDPVGILTKDKKRNARCGKCGYSCFVSRHKYRI